MHQSVAERRNYQACPYRLALEPDNDNLAICRLIQDITDFPEHSCHVGNDVCTACCRTAWPNGNRMNAVVASVIYDRADQILATAPTEIGGNRLADIKRSALDYLEVLPGESVPRTVPARATRRCCYLGE